MSPPPLFNWLCVANGLAKVLTEAATIRANQLAANPASRHANSRTSAAALRPTPQTLQQHRDAQGQGPSSEASTTAKQTVDDDLGFNDTLRDRPDIQSSGSDSRNIPSQTMDISSSPISPSSPLNQSTGQPRGIPDPIETSAAPSEALRESDDIFAIGASAERAVSSNSHFGEEPQPISQPQTPPPFSSDTQPNLPQYPARALQSSKVPSSRIGRLFHYGGLAASLGYGAAAEVLRRSTTSTDNASSQSLILTEGNVTRLVSKLSQMRGAALKLGQFLSIQDTHVLPEEVERIFRRVQDSAHYMPNWQMERVLSAALGAEWMQNFTAFERIPFAAASIGQVHSAVLAPSASPTGKEEPVAVKIQFPGVRESIESDLGYIRMLLTASRVLPRGLFLDKSIKVLSEELADECDYRREGESARAFRDASRLGADPRFKVPWVWDGSTQTVLVMEHVNGVSVGGDVVGRLRPDERDEIASRIIELCLLELFSFRLMQTDPNWTNFLWNSRTRQIELVDFGATRSYSKEFMDKWLRLLQAAAESDKDACTRWSRGLGYLTGEENELMLDAHFRSLVLLGTPFRKETSQPFVFKQGPGSAWGDITTEIRGLIPVMLQHRLTPPPQETYSLNRKLSGAFLLASRLGARVDCKAIWDKVVGQYRFD